ncbi:MAG: DnaA regulatory inactivator Hda [Gammaproteobacteria bacterium]|nr:DnaA regulatory inactivator Hda [Gammaproteobacteria bacterium]
MQLPLAIEFPESATFDSFQAGSNRLLVELIKKTVSNSGELQLYIWSATGMGKTHLLQAACRAASEQGRKACYLPFSVMSQHSPQLLEGLETLDLITIDDLDQIVPVDGWQQAVFSLINRCRAGAVPIVFAARCNIGELSLNLADLRSRLAWGPLFEIKALSDLDKIKVLQARARQRSLELSNEVGQYLLSHYPRDMCQLCDLLDTLDKASLAAQRRLTIPFVKTVLESR